MRSLIIATVALGLSGCAGGYDLSLLGDIGGTPAEALAKAQEVEDVVLGNAVKALPPYCKAPIAAREILRARINARPEAEGAQIGVFCPGDPVLTLGP